MSAMPMPMPMPPDTPAPHEHPIPNTPQISHAAVAINIPAPRGDDEPLKGAPPHGGKDRHGKGAGKGKKKMLNFFGGNPRKRWWRWQVILHCVTAIGVIITIILSAVALGVAQQANSRQFPEFPPPDYSWSAKVLPSIVTPRLSASYAPTGTGWDYGQNTPGLRLTFPSPGNVSMAESTAWTIAGWTMRVIQMVANATYTFPVMGQTNYVVVLNGSLVMTSGAGSVLRSAVPSASPGMTSARAWGTSVQAGFEEPVVFVYLQADPTALQQPINQMFPSRGIYVRSPEFTGMSSSALQWYTFPSVGGSCGTVGYNCTDLYNMRGIEIYSTETRVAYLEFFAAGPSVSTGWQDLNKLTPETTYELMSFVLATGNTGGGIVVQGSTATPLTSLIAQPGLLLGPVFQADSTGLPTRSATGVIQYYPYQWKSAAGAKAYDVWMNIQRASPVSEDATKSE